MKMNKNITRRYALVALVATISFFPSSILAFSKSDAEGLIKNLTVDVLSAVNEQKSEDTQRISKTIVHCDATAALDKIKGAKAKLSNRRGSWRTVVLQNHDLL